MNRSSYSARRRHEGAALITVLLVMAIVTILLTKNMSTSVTLLSVERALSNRALVNQIMLLAELEAVGQLETKRDQTNQLDTQGRSKQINGILVPWAEPAGFPGWSYRVTVQDLQARLNLNLLETNVGYQQAFERLAEGLSVPELDAIMDWLDNDSDRRGLGAEDYQYLSKTNPYLAANQKLTHESEIRLIEGMSPEAWLSIKGRVVALPESAKININTASEELLLALDPNIDVGAISSRRGGSDSEFGGGDVEDNSDFEFSEANNDSSLFATESTFYELNLEVTNSVSSYKQNVRIRIDDTKTHVFQRYPVIDVPDAVLARVGG